jgi:hypothetical protein
MSASQGLRRAVTRILGARAGMDGLDDLGIVDPLQVDRSDSEIAVAELALDDDQRHAFTSQLDGVRVPELLRREASANASCDGRLAQIGAGGCLVVTTSIPSVIPPCPSTAGA